MRKDTGWDSQYTYNEKTDLKECPIDDSFIEEIFKNEISLQDEEEGKIEVFNLLENLKTKNFKGP